MSQNIPHFFSLDDSLHFDTPHPTWLEVYNDHDDTASDDEYEHDTSSTSSQISRSSVEVDPLDHDYGQTTVKRFQSPNQAHNGRNFSTRTALNVKDEERERTGRKARPDSVRSSSYESDRAADDVFEVLQRLHDSNGLLPANLTKGLSQHVSHSMSIEMDDHDIMEDPGRVERHKRSTPSSTRREVSQKIHLRNTEEIGSPRQNPTSKLSTPMKPSSSGLSADPFWPTPRSPRYNRSGSNRQSSHRNSARQEERADDMRVPTAQVSKVKKEFKLLLLQCTVMPSVLPYSDEVIQSILPRRLQQDMARLSRTLTRTVLERGLLIAHPGDDYDVLEERVLESLGLKLSRIGQCGHFLGGTSRERGNFAHYEASISDVSSPRTTPDCCTCVDCAQHLADSLEHRRWEIKVFAGNGLMSACAWTAAWREMEKTDVEIGIHIPEHLRERLEEEQHRLETRPITDDASEPEADYSSMPFQDVEPLQDPKLMEQMELPMQIDVTPQISTPRRLSAKGPLPLSTLLVNYAKRRFAQSNLDSHNSRQYTLVLALVGVVLLLAASRTFKGEVPGMEPLSAASPPWNDIPSTASWVKQAGSKVTHLVEATPYPVCTFPMESAGQYRMTALPEDIASKVLGSWSSSSVEIGFHLPTPSAVADALENVFAPDDRIPENEQSGNDIVETFAAAAADVVHDVEEVVESVESAFE